MRYDIRYDTTKNDVVEGFSRYAIPWPLNPSDTLLYSNSRVFPIGIEVFPIGIEVNYG
jgi:hypothetical protein